MSVGNLHFVFGKMSIWSFCPLFNQVVWFFDFEFYELQLFLKGIVSSIFQSLLNLNSLIPEVDIALRVVKPLEVVGHHLQNSCIGGSRAWLWNGSILVNNYLFLIF